MTDFLHRCRPTVSKRILYLIAALAWALAGGILMVRGTLVFYNTASWPVLSVLSLTGGLLMYITLFSKISLKHILRIKYLPYDDHCMFSFFSLKSYLLMSVMISAGMIIRQSSLISPEYLAVIYITMGTPLLLSSWRFFDSFRKYRLA